MKNTRKLIPAVVMLLVSAVLMSTASFAWFSMNKEVTATGMTVTATTPASLEIATSNPGAWSYGVTLDNDATGLNPITRHTDGKWYVPGTKNVIDHTGKAKYSIGATYPITEGETTLQFADCWTEVELDYNDGTDAGDTKYALVQKLYLRTNDGAVETGKTSEAIQFAAKATVGGESALKGGVKVYLKVGNVISELNSATSTTDNSWVAPLSSASANSAIEVLVVVVYDGNVDTIVNNTNADLKETSVSVTFSAVEP